MWEVQAPHHASFLGRVSTHMDAATMALMHPQQVSQRCYPSCRCVEVLNHEDALEPSWHVSHASADSIRDACTCSPVYHITQLQLTLLHVQ